jgi:SAM-dependent methyltransferase
LIFDREKVRIHRDLTAANRNQNFKFFEAASLDIIDRLNCIDKEYIAILDVGCRSGILTKLLKNTYNNAEIISTDISAAMLATFEHLYKYQVDEENLSPLYTELNLVNNFDLIIFSMGLHWINDIPGFLKQIYSMLKPDGIFIANFIGGESLKNLRNKLIETEVKAKRPHAPHISPFIHFDHVTPLLQQAGFNEIIVDYEIIEFEQKMGESNALLKTSNYSLSKDMLTYLSDDSQVFKDKVNLVSFIVYKNKNTIKLKTNYLDV